MCAYSEVEDGIVNELALVTVISYNPPAFFVPVNPVNVKFLMFVASFNKNILQALLSSKDFTVNVKSPELPTSAPFNVITSLTLNPLPPFQVITSTALPPSTNTLNTASLPTSGRILSPSVVVYCKPDTLHTSLTEKPWVDVVVIVQTPVALS